MPGEAPLRRLGYPSRGEVSREGHRRPQPPRRPGGISRVRTPRRAPQAGTRGVVSGSCWELPAAPVVGLLVGLDWLVEEAPDDEHQKEKN